MPYRTVDNIIDGIVLTFVDITEMKNTEELQRLAAVVKDSNDAVTVQDLDGKILAWNRGASRMYGWKEAEALKMNVREIVPQEKRNEAIALIKRIKKGEEIQFVDTQRITKEGKLMDVRLVVTTLVDDKNRITSIATTERDITGRGKNKVAPK